MPGRWVTFDCYGTIVDWNAGLAAALTEVFGDEPAASLIDGFHDAEKRVKHGDGYHRYREVLARSVREMGTARGRPVDEQEMDVIARHWPSIRPFPDAGTGLQALRDRGFRLAILTNCDDDLFAETRAQLPVPIDEVVTAEQVRSYKPDHGHFEEFRRRVDPDAWVHAANSWEHDIVPAAELGLPRIWVDRDRSGHDASLASVRIDDFARLADEADRLAGS
jgi:2-haloacid dehalogenase